MEHLYEDAVMWFLTQNGKRFVCPQYVIFNGKGGHSDVDFLALDFHAKTAFIVEVTTQNDDGKKLAGKFRKNAQWWLEVLPSQLKEQGHTLEWKIKAKAFLRQEAIVPFRIRLENVKMEVEPESLEQAFARWNWQIPKESLS